MAILLAVLLIVLVTFIAIVRRKTSRKTAEILSTNYKSNTDTDLKENYDPSQLYEEVDLPFTTANQVQDCKARSSTELSTEIYEEVDVPKPLLTTAPNQAYGLLAQHDVELQQNEAYIKTPAIPVGANECYGATTTTSVDVD